MIVELIEQFFDEYPASEPDTIDTDEVITAVAKISRLTCSQNGTIRQQMIEKLMRYSWCGRLCCTALMEQHGARFPNLAVKNSDHFDSANRLPSKCLRCRVGQDVRRSAKHPGFLLFCV